MKLNRKKLVESRILNESPEDDDDFDLSEFDDDDLGDAEEFDGEEETNPTKDDDNSADDVDDFGDEFEDDEEETPAKQPAPAKQDKTVDKKAEIPDKAPKQDVKPVKKDDAKTVDGSEAKTNAKKVNADPAEVLDQLPADTEVQVSTGEVVGKSSKPAPTYKEVDQVMDYQNLIKLKSNYTIPENTLVKTLDKSLRAAKQASLEMALRDPEDRPKNWATRFNILVEGLPGSAKTAIIKSWAGARGVSLFSLNAKDMKLELSLNGTPMRNTKSDNDSLTIATTDSLKPLNRRNSVLFLDEFNRQKDAQIRGSLLTLIGDHCVYGKDSNDQFPDQPEESDWDDFSSGTESENVGATNYIFYPNLLFTVAAINPKIDTDDGVADLNDAEYSRFISTVKLDSNKTNALNYIEWFYDKEAAAITKNLERAKANPGYKFTYLSIKGRQLLGSLLVGDKDFKFDDRSKLTDLYVNQKTMLNQRLICDALQVLVYKIGNEDMIDQLKTWVGYGINSSQLKARMQTVAAEKGLQIDNKTSANKVLDMDDTIYGMSNLLDEDKDMIIRILDNIHEPFTAAMEDEATKVPGYEGEDVSTSKEVAAQASPTKGGRARNRGEETDSDMFANKKSVGAKSGALNSDAVDGLLNSIAAALDKA